MIYKRFKSKNVFHDALKATAKHRGSFEKITDTEPIMKQISKSTDLQQAWLKYQKKFQYAKDIYYENVIKVIKYLLER